MRRTTVAALVAGTLVVSACGGDSEADEIVVFAAASLTNTFEEIGELYEAEHDGVSVTFNFGPSSGLAEQIISGAPVDVFASASGATMDQVVDAELADGDPVVFVSNRLQIAVPPGNPGGVTGLADFANEDLIIAVCEEQVPCGALAVQVFEAAGIVPAPDTYEEDVRATLNKVELGEVDAALVYRTDVLVAGDNVEGIDFPESGEAITNYPIATVVDAPAGSEAQSFVDFVLSEQGLSVLEAAGFDGP